jgi:hypothetical protein
MSGTNGSANSRKAGPAVIFGTFHVVNVKVQIITPVAPYLEGRSLHAISLAVSQPKSRPVPDSKTSKYAREPRYPQVKCRAPAARLSKCRQFGDLPSLGVRGAASDVMTELVGIRTSDIAE